MAYSTLSPADQIINSASNDGLRKFSNVLIVLGRTLTHSLGDLMGINIDSDKWLRISLQESTSTG